MGRKHVKTWCGLVRRPHIADLSHFVDTVLYFLQRAWYGSPIRRNCNRWEVAIMNTLSVSAWNAHHSATA